VRALKDAVAMGLVDAPAAAEEAPAASGDAKFPEGATSLVGA
jgi:hypothetical protein